MIFFIFYLHVNLASSIKIDIYIIIVISAQASLSPQYSTQMSTHLALCVCPSWRRTKTGGLPSPSNRSDHKESLKSKDKIVN